MLLVGAGAFAAGWLWMLGCGPIAPEFFRGAPRPAEASGGSVPSASCPAQPN